MFSVTFYALVRTYYRHMTFHNLTGSTADTFMEYVQRNLPEGVAMKVTKVLYLLLEFFFLNPHPRFCSSFRHLFNNYLHLSRNLPTS